MKTFQSYLTTTLDDLYEIAVTNERHILSPYDEYIVESIRQAFEDDRLDEAVTMQANRVAPSPSDPMVKRVDKTNQLAKDFKTKPAIQDATPINVSSMTPGQFYHFQYKSKWYELGKLDFYEKNPLIACIDRTPKIILGLNFHYISPADRLQTINKLKSKYGQKWDDQLSNVPLTWEDAKSMFEGRAKRMIKAYLPKRISNCFQIDRLGLYNLCSNDTSNFTPEVVKSIIWKNPADIKGNNFKLK